MSIRPIVYPPPGWTNQDIVLYHGTVEAVARSIITQVEIGKGKPNGDFGPGFYTTTSGLQANNWAAKIAATMSPPGIPAVIKIKVRRGALASLDALAFVRGDFHAEDYWSFVHYCRRGSLDHGRVGSKLLYDVVYGPLAAFWNQRLLVADADQVSFHTDKAEDLLNESHREQIV